MLTYEKHSMAFEDSASRDAFFARTKKVKPGTTMEHVLGTNLGAWGDLSALRWDAARIMKIELDTWATENGEEKLKLPVEGIVSHALFREAIDRLTRINAREIDSFVASLSSSNGKGAEKEMGVPKEDERFLGKAFVEELYLALASKADRLRIARDGVREALDHRKVVVRSPR